MQLRQLEYFVRLAESRHFGRVAEQVGLSTSDISQQVRKLEGELGLELFVRTSRSVEITPAGTDLLPLATSILTDVEALRRSAEAKSNAMRQTLRICYFPGAGRIVSAAARYLVTAEPGLTLDFEVCRSSEAVARVASAPQSIGVVRSLPHQLSRLKLATYAYRFLAVPIGHALEKKARISIEDLSNQPLIYTTKGFQSNFRERICAFFESHCVSPEFVAYDCVNYAAALDFVGSGKALALVPETVATGQPRSDIKYRRMEGPAPNDEIEMVWNGLEIEPLRKKFLEAVQQSKAELDSELIELAL